VNTDVKASGLTSESKAGLGEEHINTRSQDTYVETIESKNKRDVCKGSFNAHKTENILGKKEKEDRLLGDNPTNVSPLDRSDSLPPLGGDTSKLWTSSRTKHGYSRGVYHTASKGKTKSTLPENHKLINTDDYCLLSDKQRIIWKPIDQRRLMRVLQVESVKKYDILLQGINGRKRDRTLYLGYLIVINQTPIQVLYLVRISLNIRAGQRTIRLIKWIPTTKLK